MPSFSSQALKPSVTSQHLQIRISALALTGLLALIAGLTFLRPFSQSPKEKTVHGSAAWPVDEEAAQSLRDFLQSAPAVALPPPAVASKSQGLESEAGAPFKAGIALGLFSRSVDYDYGELIDEIGEHHAGWVALFYNMYQRNGKSSSMKPLTRIRDQERIIRRSAEQAHRRGLKVLSFPVVLLRRPREDEWRGNLDPRNVDRWFRNYGEHIVRLARLAEELKIEAFCVGSELSSLELHGNRWRDLIAQVRQVYSGEVIYSANWDHYQRMPFWNSVDAIGLSGYFELSRSTDPSLEVLTKEWTRLRKTILAWSAREQGSKPIVFTEIGYSNQDGTNMYPWDYAREAPPDPREQAMCYEAFIRAWHGQPGFGGAFFYNWFGFDSLTDTGYSPRGKPAAELIKIWYGGLEQDSQDPGSAPGADPLDANRPPLESNNP